MCFHGSEDVFFALSIAPLLDGFANSPTALSFSEYEDGVSSLSRFVQGMWTRVTDLKEPSFKSEGYNQPTDKAEIDALEVLLQYAFKNQTGSSTTQTVRIRRSTGRFIRSFSSPNGRGDRMYSGSCARFDIAGNDAIPTSGSADTSGKGVPAGTKTRISQSPHSEIDEVIQSGRYFRLPPALVVAHSTDSGPSHLSVVNRTAYNLTVTFYGATERSVRVTVGPLRGTGHRGWNVQSLGKGRQPDGTAICGRRRVHSGHQVRIDLLRRFQKLP